MVGEPIAQVQEGMRKIVQELQTDPYALETAFLSVIAFAGKAKCLMPLTELYKFYPPALPIGGGTSLGAALNLLMDEMDHSLVRTTAEQKGDWKPVVFLFTDGTPTDDPTPAIERWTQHYSRRANIVAIAIGEGVDTSQLSRISNNVMRLSETDDVSFQAFFKWVTASIKTTSLSVSTAGKDDVKLAPVSSSINLKKETGERPCVVDENYVVLLGRCSNTQRPYLVKYGRRLYDVKGLEGSGVQGSIYRLVGAYAIDEASYDELSDGRSNRQISTAELRGVPTCPCCGNQLGVVICECGHIMCADPGGAQACPWCGLKGTLGQGSGETHITRGRG